MSRAVHTWLSIPAAIAGVVGRPPAGIFGQCLVRRAKL